MPNEVFWRERFNKLGAHSVGPGDTQDEDQLEEHRQYFLRGLADFLPLLNGPVLDFGCGVGRWVNDLPRPYLGLDLLPDHISYCRTEFSDIPDVGFELSSSLATLPDEKFNSVFTCTVLQHIVEPVLRRQIIESISRVLSEKGTFLSVEWATDQKQYDWCKAVRKSEFTRYFSTKNIGEVVENGRRHTIWLLNKRNSHRLWF